MLGREYLAIISPVVEVDPFVTVYLETKMKLELIKEAAI